MRQELWFTSKELAEMKLPGLPGTERGVQKRFKPLLEKLQAEGKARKRQGRGGGCEYHISALPQETVAFLNQDAYEATSEPLRARVVIEVDIRIEGE